MYYVRLFYNTGYDIINIPETPKMLNDCVYFDDIPAIDLIEGTFLSVLKIKYDPMKEEIINAGGANQSIHDIDYCAVSQGNYKEFNPDYNANGKIVYYSVITVQPEGSDVLSLVLAKDYITSAGGFSKLRLSAGVITRISKHDNAYANNSFIPDDYLGTAKPLRLMIHTVKGFEGDALHPPRAYTFAESTVNLESDLNHETIEDVVQGLAEMQLYIPEAGNTEYFLGGDAIHGPNANSIALQNPSGAQLFDVDKTYVKRGMALARALGIDSAISDQFKIQAEFADYISDPDGGIAQVFGLSKTDIDTEFDIIPYGIDTDRIYTRIFSGEVSKIGIVAGGGEMQFNPEDLANIGAYPDPEQFDNDIKLTRFVDPRSNGCPYYRFKYINGDSGYMAVDPHPGSAETLIPVGGGPMFNAIRGCVWERVALRFTTISGLAVRDMTFKQAMGIKNLQLEAGLLGRQAQQRQAGIQYDLMYDQYKNWSLPNAIFGNVPVNAGQGFSSGYSYRNLGKGLGYGDTYNSGAALGNAAAALELAQKAGQAFLNVAQEQENLTAALHSQNEQLKFMSKDIQSYNAIQNAEIEAEKAKFGVESNVIAPQTNFVDDADLFRDFTNNGVIIYRYIPQNYDLSRLNKIIKMFGEKVNETITNNADRLNNQTFPSTIQQIGILNHGYYFTYVQIQGAEVNEAGGYNETIPTDPLRGRRGVLNRSERQGIAAQLAGGVRIWKKTNPKNYESNYTDFLNLRAGDPTPTQDPYPIWNKNEQYRY